MSGPYLRRFAALVVFATLSYPSVTAAQETISRPAPSLLTIDMTPGDQLLLVTGGALTWLAYKTDAPKAAARALDPYIGVIGDLGDPYGSTYGALVVWATITNAALLTDDQRFKAASVELASALLLTGGVVGTMKAAINRRRPNNADYSFPSGHTSVAFTTSTVLARNFGWKIGAPAYGLAVLTGLGRVEENKHYLSDVAAGATIGVLVARNVTPWLGNFNLTTYGEAQRVGVGFDF